MPAVKTKFDTILDQHALLRSMVAELRSFLENPRPALEEEDCESWAQCLAERLTKLHGSVRTHFREEERSGFLDDLEEEFPRAANAIQALRRDHDRILADFRAVLSSVMVYSEGRTPENTQLRSWVFDILEQLSRHEEEETDLFQELMYQELGVGD
jgi:hypothetical protein